MTFSKRENIEIEPLQNGYLVTYSYRVMTNPEAKDSFDRYDYINEKSVFTTWEDTIAFVQTKKMEVPAEKSND